MRITELMDAVLKGSKCLGTFTLTELLEHAATRSITGIAMVKDRYREQYLAFLSGEPEGAIFIDDNGTLYGDKAVMMIEDKQPFELHEVNADLVDSLIMGCRIFEKTHIKQSTISSVPEFGQKNVGIGVLTIVLHKDAAPLNGLRVSIRKEGKILGSDVTTGDGSVGFRVKYGKYTCIVQDKMQNVTNYPVDFDASHSKIILNL